MQSLLARQLRRLLGLSGDDDLGAFLQFAERVADGNDIDARHAAALRGLKAFVKAVDSSYEQSIRDLDLRGRSLMLSSDELSSANDRLREEAAKQRALVDSMTALADQLLFSLGRTPSSGGKRSLDELSALIKDLVAENEASQLELRTSEARFRQLTEISSDWYWEQDANYRFTLISRGVSAATGRENAHFIGKTRPQAFGGDPQSPMWQAHDRMLEAHAPFRDFEFNYTGHNGAMVYVSVSGNPVFDANGRFGGYQGLARNITARMQADARLRETLRFTETLINSMPNPVTVKDRDHRFVRINAAHEREFGTDGKLMLGKTSVELIGDSAREVHAVEDQMITNPETRYLTQIRTLQDGSKKHFIITKAAVKDEKGEVTGFITSHADVTDLKLAEARVEEQLRLTNVILESSPAPMMVKDAQRKTTYVNAAYERLFGVRREDVMNSVMRAQHDSTTVSFIENIEIELLRDQGTRQFEYVLKATDGRNVHCVITKSTYANASGEVGGIVTTYGDITALKSAERAAAEQARLTSILIEASPAPLVVKDRNLQLTGCNTAYEKQFEVRREDILHRPLEAHRSEFSREVEVTERRMLAEGGMHQMERTIITPSGRRIDCIVTKSTYSNTAGEVSGIITSFTDITQQKNAEREAAEQLRLTAILMDASPIPTGVKDRNLQLISCNTAYEKLFEARREDILFKPHQTHGSSIVDEVREIELSLLANGGAHQIERKLIAPSGRAIYCIVNKSTFSNAAGEVSGIITTFTDITEIKRTEENLITARQAAEDAMRARSQFLANMSHEIRTPMNGVLGMTSLLYATPLEDEQREYVDTLKMSGEALLKIINDILDFSKIEAGKVEIEKTAFDVRSRVTAIMQLFAASARERKLSLTSDIAADVPHTVIGDPVRIGQALSNIVANAIKFTLEGGVHVTVAMASRDGAGMVLRFDVKDSGIGIAQEAIDKIFNPFSQEDASTTRRFGGTGLGLTISRELVELMGGELTVESIPGKGSRFSFTVNVAATEAPEQDEGARAVRTVSESPGAAGRANVVEVLLAEDNKVNQLVATRMLEKLGCKVTVASDGAQAVDLASRHRFDLILMDCHMPNMDGFAATAAIRALEHGGDTHRIIVAQTANAMEGDRETCLKASMDDYVTKPFTTETLAGVIKRWAPGALAR